MYFNNMFNNFFPFRNSYSFRPQNSQQSSYQDPRIIISQKILSDKSNFYCFDCGRQLNDLNYFDLKNAIFLCYNCALQHQKYPKEISEVVTGNIRTLDQRYIMPLYYGGNKNLIEFIRNNYPLLEKKGRNNIYTSKAIDYYRKLIQAKINNEREPSKPSKLDGYNSIYNISPKNKIYEPADINNNQNYDDNDIEMKDAYDNNNESDENTSQDSSREENKKKEKVNINDKKDEGKNININSPKKDIKKNINEERCLTLNQIGNIHMYPDAKDIDGMDC